MVRLKEHQKVCPGVCSANSPARAQIRFISLAVGRWQTTCWLSWNRRPTVLWLAFLLCVAFSAITIPFLSEDRLPAAALGFGGIFVLGICISATIDAGGYCGTMLFRTISIYMPGWIAAFMLARTIVVTGRSVDGVRPSAGRVVRRGVLWLAAIAAFGLITLLSIAADPMVESRNFEYNGQHYVGTLIGLSTDPVIYEDMGPIVCRKLDLPYDSPLYHELANAYWKARY